MHLFAEYVVVVELSAAEQAVNSWCDTTCHT